MKHLTVNLTPTERVARVGLGLLGAVTGLIMLLSASGAFVIVLLVLLILAGIDLVVTGATGHCPLYKKLGFVPQSLRGSA